MLRIENLSAYYDSIAALKSVSIEVAKGEVVSIIGANGAGKSTTLLTISGIQPAKKGEIRFKGEPIQQLRPEQVAEKGVRKVLKVGRFFPACLPCKTFRWVPF
jgi:branched-chain amino acid transport system ATP-binding protein